MFLPDPVPKSRTVLPAGDRNARIAIIGDYTDNFDLAGGKPFSGPAGSVLESCLHAAGLIRAEVYLTNVVKSPPSGKVKGANGPYSEFFNLNTQGVGKFTEAGARWVETLREELKSVHANVLVAAGPAAYAALCGGRKLSTYRGYVRNSVGFGNGNGGSAERKVIPTYSPADTVRGQYINRTVIAIDLGKAKVESAFPEIRRPHRNLIYQYSSMEECLSWIDVLAQSPILTFDIEVVNYEVACISFSTRPDLGVVVPITDMWTLEEELIIWRAIQKLLGNPHTIKVAQNAIFDIHFLLTRVGVEVRGEVHDTMIGHSVMFCELPKGLGFLGSVYCGSQAYWKDLVKFDDIKGES